MRSVLIIGMHPDEATESIVDIAQMYNKKFAIVPCCVFPKIFPNRFLKGNFVSDYPNFVKYLENKISNCVKDHLNFIGRNKILYTN